MISDIKPPVPPQPKQFSPEERNFIAMSYQLHRGTHFCYRKVVTAFSGKFPLAKIPDKRTVHRIWDKQQKFYTVHNLNSSASPGDTHSGRSRTTRSAENIADVRAVVEEDAVKPADDPEINT